MQLEKLYNKTLKEICKDESRCENITITKSFLDNLFEEYYPFWAVEDFYDSELEIKDEDFNMYLDYQMKNCSDEMKITGMGFWAGMMKMVDNEKEPEDKERLEGKFSTKEHTDEELKEAYEKVKKAYEDYEERKLEFNNWEELYEEGVWGMNQQHVNDSTKYMLFEAADKNDGLPFRTTKITYDDNSFMIFNFTRDLLEKDTRMFFVRKGYKYDYKKEKTVKDKNIFKNLFRRNK